MCSPTSGSSRRACGRVVLRLERGRGLGDELERLEPTGNGHPSRGCCARRPLATCADGGGAAARFVFNRRRPPAPPRFAFGSRRLPIRRPSGPRRDVPPERTPVRTVEPTRARARGNAPPGDRGTRRADPYLSAAIEERDRPPDEPLRSRAISRADGHRPPRERSPLAGPPMRSRRERRSSRYARTSSGVGEGLRAHDRGFLPIFAPPLEPPAHVSRRSSTWSRSSHPPPSPRGVGGGGSGGGGGGGGGRAAAGRGFTQLA